MKTLLKITSTTLIIIVTVLTAQSQRTTKPRDPYANPANYDTAASKAKGDDYLECKINGQQFGMYNNSNSSLTIKRSPTIEAQDYIVKDIPNKKEVYLIFSNPALWPDIRKFDFGKPGFKTTKADRYSTQENIDLYFAFGLVMKDPALNAPCRAAGHIGRTVGGDNIISGTFEILYFEPVKGGIIEAKFNLLLKGEKSREGKQQPDISITDGRLRFRMRN
ncbi:MAG: hypothetical protein ABI675_03305 [Chitinophagaceae bacterium]